MTLGSLMIDKLCRWFACKSDCNSNCKQYFDKSAGCSAIYSDNTKNPNYYDKFESCCKK